MTGDEPEVQMTGRSEKCRQCGSLFDAVAINDDGICYRCAGVELADVGREPAAESEHQGD